MMHFLLVANEILLICHQPKTFVVNRVLFILLERNIVVKNGANNIIVIIDMALLTIMLFYHNQCKGIMM